MNAPRSRTLLRVASILAVVAAGLFAARTPVRAEPVTFTLDPGRSSVTMGGTVAALGQSATLEEQEPGSLTTAYSGSIPVELEGGTIRFVAGAALIPS